MGWITTAIPQTVFLGQRQEFGPVEGEEEAEAVYNYGSETPWTSNGVEEEIGRSSWSTRTAMEKPPSW